MEIRTHLSEKDFISVTFSMSYGKFAMKFLTGIGVLALVGAIASTIYGQINGSFSPWIIASVALVFLPAITYWNAKKSYASNQRISEVIHYNFLPDQLEMVGESFQSTLTWNKIHKVTKSKKWIFIWQNAQIANPIPLRDIWEGDVQELKNILISHGVKNNL